ncbi:IS1182 family transposase [Streptomyces sp. H39-C1]|nr:IS1182 family transposase [Streptomyces sp. H39-C1]MCZ4103791.1 IS1182 family transposase [Streptomyces sp. H39-C1]
MPEMTARVARAAFPQGSLAIRIRDALGEVFADEQFSDLFAARGHPSTSPARLVMVLLLQFAEGLTDRQAAEAVRGRVDWKFLLGLPLEDPGFDASVLSEFRTRLTGQGQADRLLTVMLEHLREHRLLERGGRQRTDATHVHGAIRMLNRLELAMETMRAALETLAVATPVWLVEHAPTAWWDRYARRADDFRLPQSDTARRALAATVGADGYRLLDAVHHPATPAWLRELPTLRVLRQLWVQQYYRDAGGHRWRDKVDLPPGAVAIGSPYDTDARYGIKRGMGWRGYKGHFTEVCEPDRPHMIVHVATTAATVSDVETVTARHNDLAAADLLPDQELVDAAYVSVDHILDADADHGIDLVGPLPPDFSWQTRTPDAFDLARFTVDFDQRHVTCPTGAVSRNWRESISADGLPTVQVTFRQPDCTPCPQRARCTRSTVNARSLTFRPRQQFEAQQRLRAEQATDAWREQYALRAGIEGTMAQASRRCDVHHARYKGLAKTHLQHVLTAMALNLVRIDAWLTGTPLGGSWTSRLSTLRLSLTPP